MVRVLIVDDDPHIRLLLKSVLEMRGYTVQVAADGGEGLRMAQELAPDAMVVDGIMPVMDGIALVENLRSKPATQDLPVLFLTAMDELDADEIKERLRVHQVVRKPVDIDLLDRLLREVASLA
jgi:CheY-like chemotaxis protein